MLFWSFMQPWLIAIICIAAFIALLFALAAFTLKVAFGSRCDKDPNLYYRLPEEFSLKFEPVKVMQGKLALNGFIYTSGNVDKVDNLVIFCHGLGAGHIAYTTEIAYFCNQGYPVLALDIRGCNYSEGKNIGGMYEGVNCVKAAIDFARADSRFKSSRIILVGHSWGGYSVLCASAEKKVDKVVAISAPLTPVKTIYNGAAKIISKPFAFILSPFWYILNFFKFGVKGNLNAATCAKNCEAEVLLIHGDKDNIVPLKFSAYANASGNNIKKYMATGKSHNPYASMRAQQLLIELNEKLAHAIKPDEQTKKYLKEFDFIAATEQDSDVMQSICKFLKFA